MSKIKYSYGIALCRYNPERNNQIEILLIKKRFTYHFFNFVYGIYTNNDKYLKYLLNNMTFAEKIDILGMQFYNMWYRIWLNNPEYNFNIRTLYNQTSSFSDKDIYNLYHKKKTKFDKTFCGDGGKKIHGLIQDSNNVELIWEIPKGGKKFGELDLNCAIREFTEETSIRGGYKILHLTPVGETHKDENVVYKNIYYIAEATENIIPKIDFENFHQISEIDQIKWVSLRDIELMNFDPGYDKRLRDLYQRIIKKFKRYHKLQI